MLNISKQTIWFIIILCSLICIYYLYLCDNKKKTNYLKNNIFKLNNSYSHNETSIVQRKKVNNKHMRCKKIHTSQNQTNVSIKSMTNILTKKLNRISLRKISIPRIINNENKP